MRFERGSKIVRISAMRYRVISQPRRQTFNRLCFIWLQWMFTRVAALEPTTLRMLSKHLAPRR